MVFLYLRKQDSHAYHGLQWKPDLHCRNLPKLAVIEFRAFLVMDNKVARQAMAENGRKWQKKVHRGYLVGNGLRALFAPFPYYWSIWEEDEPSTGDTWTFGLVQASGVGERLSNPVRNALWELVLCG